VKYENELEDRAGGLAIANLHWERSLNVVFPSCQLRTVRCRSACVSRLCNKPHALGKLKMLVIPLRERLTSHWEWRDGRSSVYPRG
jgi:hypothetical protein